MHSTSAPLVRRLPRFAALALAVILPGCVRAQSAVPAPAPVRADTALLHRTLDSLATAHRGVVGYAVHNLDTGERLERSGDETFPTASLIKVPVLVTVFDLIAKGQLSLDDQLTVLRIDIVPGSGILQFLHPGMIITVRDAAWLMTTISDNTATNLLLDRIIIRRVWEKMEALGLPHTKIHSKSFLRNSSVAMDSSVKYGLGVTTPNEMARLFGLLADGKAVGGSADSTMLDFLVHNTDFELLQRFAGGARAAHKTGATDAVRTECSLWFLPARVVACVMTKENVDQRWIIDNEAQVTLGRMGESIVGAWRAPVKP
ncbi:MAG: class A beta-lactamase-related serine hydrolase [Gemmatimonadota bacterium]|nr:class A beta-lactamase-related serine hydrolase [Gemmatimonadota bacterium]